MYFFKMNLLLVLVVCVPSLILFLFYFVLFSVFVAPGECGYFYLYILQVQQRTRILLPEETDWCKLWTMQTLRGEQWGG